MANITTNFPDYELAGQGERWALIPKEHQNNLKILAKNILQPARDDINKNNPKNDIAIFITSGYRSRRHNEAAEGASNSMHLYGKAVDISCSQFTGIEFFEYMLKNFSNQVGGIGLYANENLKGKFIHIDMRPKHNGKAIVSWYFDGSRYRSPGPKMQAIFKKLGLAFVG